MQVIAQQVHQARALVRRTLPVLGRERVEGERAQAKAARGARPLPHGIASAAMTFQPRQPPLLRPAAISVHDDAHMARERALRDLRLELGDVPFDTRHEGAGTIAGMLRGASFGLGYLPCPAGSAHFASRSEEHTSELQSLAYLVCRLLL